MILSDTTIRRYLKSRDLVITPMDRHAIQAASVDCRLGSHYLVIEDNKTKKLTLEDEILYRDVIGSSYTIPPHSFVLATTL